MIGGVTRHILPHLPGVPHLHVNRHLLYSDTSMLSWVICYQWHSLEQLFWMLDQKTLVISSDNLNSVGITVNIYKNLESFLNMSLSFTNLWLETICETFFLSLWRNKTQSISSKMGELTASLSLAERWTTTEICPQFCAWRIPWS